MTAGVVVYRHYHIPGAGKFGKPHSQILNPRLQAFDFAWPFGLANPVLGSRYGQTCSCFGISEHCRGLDLDVGPERELGRSEAHPRGADGSLGEVLEVCFVEGAVVVDVVEVARDFYKRIAVWSEHFAEVGKKLEKAGEFYNKAVGSWESNVLPQGRKLEDMDIATNLPKTITDSKQVNNSLRVPSVIEESDQLDDTTNSNEEE